jgi:hypothetical protein
MPISAIIDGRKKILLRNEDIENIPKHVVDTTTAINLDKSCISYRYVTANIE